MATVILKKGEGRTVKAGGAWIYDNEIDRIDGSFEQGDLVSVQDFDGWPMGVGYLNTRSKIAVRMLSRGMQDPAAVDDAFLMKRVRDAWEYRKATVDTSSCRVIFGEADLLPGLVVDKFEDVLVVESLALGIDRLKLKILGALKEVLAEDGITVRGIYERSDAPVRRKEGMEPFKGFIGEPFDTEVEITENGVRFLVDVADGQKTGFFLDQKYNRRAIRSLCKGVRVLDCFTHTGAFALNAAAAGAREVTGVDASELAIEQARKNARLNGFCLMEDVKGDDPDAVVTFKVADVFDLLPELEAAGEKYDVVILDPPAFTKSREATKKAAKGYREINYRGMKLVKDGGFLVTCSCSHFMPQALLEKTIQEAARSAHKRLRQVEFRTQSADHPILWSTGNMPGRQDQDENSYYLKFWIFQVTDQFG
ncbi:MAG: class I SAM-dependent rRNA methyltransferase [Lachnospiraceae bacterium]|nr:class I SAM-dependent rRNA methyltransferase [Lachnospiraceae bacterium]